VDMIFVDTITYQYIC